MGEKAIDSAVGVSGYDALRKMCYAFYDYTTNNKGVFQAMLWYNKFKSDEMANATIKIFGILHKILEPLNISSNNVEHKVYRNQIMNCKRIGLILLLFIIMIRKIL